jgi:hypothetical protein
MEKPMVYLEEGCWGYTCVEHAKAVWVKPGWYEVLQEGVDLWRYMEMIVVKEDVEPEYRRYGMEQAPTFRSFNELTRYLQDCDGDAGSALVQTEDLSGGEIDAGTKCYPPVQPGSCCPYQHP